MARAAITVCALSAAAVLGCASGDPAVPGSASAGASRDGVVVTEDDRSLPRGCRPAAVAGLLGELFDALNRDDLDAARALVIDREVLRLVKRPAAGRPLRLRAVIVGLGNGLGQIEFRAAGRLVGKGAVDCETRRLVAVGLGREHARTTPICGRRPPRSAALACVRHWG